MSRALCVVVLVMVGIAWNGARMTVAAWGPEGHRVIAMAAADRLTPEARRAVSTLLDGRSLSDIASWADDYAASHRETAKWHYVDLPTNATSYVRARDCRPSPVDGIGDCVIERIRSEIARLEDTRLRKADRAEALEFVVHFVADVHQPFHAIGTSAGGNAIRVTAFGSASCGRAGAVPRPCTLHGVWDTSMLLHEHRSDRQVVLSVEALMNAEPPGRLAIDTPEAWAMESHDAAAHAMLSTGGNVDEAYFRAEDPVMEARLAMAALRLAAILNRAFANGVSGR